MPDLGLSAEANILSNAIDVEPVAPVRHPRSKEETQKPWPTPRAQAFRSKHGSLGAILLCLWLLGRGCRIRNDAWPLAIQNVAPLRRDFPHAPGTS